MLENTLYRIKKDKKLNVAYFGGSITEGAGASDPDIYCWRALTTKWLQDTYPDAEINEIQAAIGGTGTGLGIYRCDIDLADKLPDLVFYEFSVNDNGGSFASLTSNAETILRKIWAKIPTADIIIIHTTTKDISDDLDSGHDFTSRTSASAVANYYRNIPIIDIGEVLRNHIKTDGGDWLKYTLEGVHPNDTGYAVYADCVISTLAKYLNRNAPEKMSPKILPEKQLSPIPLTMTARLEDAYGAELGDGWNRVEKDMCGRYPHYIEATEPGSVMTFKFTGRGIGAYWIIAGDGGEIEFCVDGIHTGNEPCFDCYAVEYDRAGDTMFAEGLEYGEHVLKIKVTDKKSNRSKGHACRIGAFKVN
ncbi:MAG: SGNH/GDSL hydrolase family protein [Clostridia bacterium]|nr:SGNH/GDSL hydrolase family protein [Clostridia bacterium]